MAFTSIDNPELYFQCKLYTGNGTDDTAQTFDGDENMQPNMTWIKSRSDAENQHIFDSVRGANKRLLANTTGTEFDDSSNLQSFDSDGFTLGTADGINKNTATFTCWAWKESATAGFDIVSYAGTGSEANQSHSLSSAPKLIITKSRGSTTDWKVHTSAIDGSWDVGNLNTNAAFGNSSYNAATSSVFNVGSGAPTNASSTNYISYLFHNVQGYSRIGKYTGNGSATDGPFIYTGFRPAYVIAKETSGTGHWRIRDNKRSPINAVGIVSHANAATADTTEDNIDFLSNGFKLYTSGAENNGSGDTYIYAAFAEAPFVNSKGVPCNAR
tara:strand:- start:28 stop:1008 length:981 start_codon:yes stop_codon:yes gene_type:complete